MLNGSTNLHSTKFHWQACIKFIWISASAAAVWLFCCISSLMLYGGTVESLYQTESLYCHAVETQQFLIQLFLHLNSCTNSRNCLVTYELFAPLSPLMDCLVVATTSLTNGQIPMFPTNLISIPIAIINWFTTAHEHINFEFGTCDK